MPTSGSSPLTRGKLPRPKPRRQARGLIPAHAGKTPCSWRFRARARAHPRSRGENCLQGCARSGERGSSPLTRGKPPIGDRLRTRRRLIPAHAGKTVCSSATVAAAWAHPRSRGENRRHIQTHPGETGSSPLTRGKRTSGRTARRSRGLIPAHAGKTSPLTALITATRAHPRSRGENSPSCSCGDPPPGSSPLTRGKLPAHSLRG